MRYCEYDLNGYILEVGTGSGGVEIEKDRYDAVIAAIATKPAATGTTDYRLKTDLTWEEYEVEPEPYEPTDEDKAQAYDILTGVTE